MKGYSVKKHGVGEDLPPKKNQGGGVREKKNSGGRGSKLKIFGWVVQEIGVFIQFYSIFCQNLLTM